MNACKHSRDGFCRECADKKPYLVFRLCKNRCLSCNECGYVWGPGHPQSGERPPWISPPKKDH